MSDSSVDSLFRYLPLRLNYAINSLPTEIKGEVTELRLRKNAPVSITVGRKNLTFDHNGRICDLKSGMRITASEISDCIGRLTENSLYTYDEYMKNGFIPLANGCRAGVCGSAVAGGGWREITGINLRVARFVPYAAEELIKSFASDGIKSTLVCAPPALGKTTFLKSAAFMLANGIGIPQTRVGIADERGELTLGITENGLIDSCSFLPKHKGIELLTRTMSPEIIICDEISASEAESLNESQNCGVAIIASAHCTDPKELLLRGRMKSIAAPERFPLCAILGYNGKYTCSVKKTEELL